MIKLSCGLYVEYPLFLSEFNETEFLRQFLKNKQIIKFHEHLSSGSRVVLYGRRTGGQT